MTPKDDGSIEEQTFSISLRIAVSVVLFVVAVSAGTVTWGLLLQNKVDRECNNVKDLRGRTQHLELECATRAVEMATVKTDINYIKGSVGRVETLLNKQHEDLYSVLKHHGTLLKDIKKSSSSSAISEIREEQ